MPVDDLDTVKSGALLERVGARLHEDSIRCGEAQEASLRATLDKLTAGPLPDEIVEARAANADSLPHRFGRPAQFLRGSLIRRQ